MSNKKSRMTVYYFRPGDEVDGGRLMFKYLVTAERGAPKRPFKVSIMSLDPVGHPHAAAPAVRMIDMESVTEALVAGQALVNSHHVGLKAVASPVETGD